MSDSQSVKDGWIEVFHGSLLASEYYSLVRRTAVAVYLHVVFMSVGEDPLQIWRQPPSRHSTYPIISSASTVLAVPSLPPWRRLWFSNGGRGSNSRPLSRKSDALTRLSSQLWHSSDRECRDPVRAGCWVTPDLLRGRPEDAQRTDDW